MKTYKLSQFKVPLSEAHLPIEELLWNRLKKHYKLASNFEVKALNIVKKSIDARRKDSVSFVYTLEFQLVQKEKNKKAKEINLKEDQRFGLGIVKEKKPMPELVKGEKEMKHRPVIVGFGPAGIFAALRLAEEGYKPIVIERGKSVEERGLDVSDFWSGKRELDENSNVQFGEGGAGTFSDGKLTTGIKDYRIKKVLTEFVKNGANLDILYTQKPHIGTDVLRVVVRNIRKKIEELGGEILFSHKLIDIETEGLIHKNLEDNSVQETNDAENIDYRRVSSVKVENLKNGNIMTMETEVLILAIGHSARDTFEMLHNRSFELEQKNFSMGVRIEHPQEIIDNSQYGKANVSRYRELLPPADYKLNYRCESGRGVYTFCMCPGGEVVMAASEKGRAVTNGMSYRDRNSKIANSGLLVDVRKEDFQSSHPLAGVEFQRKYETLAYENGDGYRGPQCNVGEFLSKTGAGESVIKSLPEFVSESIMEALPKMGNKLHGFDSKDAVLTAVESRSSSPVRMLRDKGYECSVTGVYPAGEGLGHAGGITSAACDGIKIAESIIKKFENVVNRIK